MKRPISESDGFLKSMETSSSSIEENNNRENIDREEQGLSSMQYMDEDAPSCVQDMCQEPLLSSRGCGVPMADNLLDRVKETPHRLQPVDVMREIIPEDEEWSAAYRDQPQTSEELADDMVVENYSRRKLSESRGIKLPNIDVTPLPQPHPSPVKSCLTPCGKNGGKGKHKQVTYADQRDSSTGSSTPSIQTPSIAESPIAYTFKQPGLTVDTSLRSTQSSLNSAQRRAAIEQINVTVYRADMKGYKFSFPAGQKKTARDMLDQLASHFDIDEKVFRSCCSIWIVSDLLELQLRDCHEPWEVRKKWPLFLKQYACAEENEMKKDEPLLFLRRNVHLSIEKEKSIEEQDRVPLTEILYHAARDEVISGRYACDLRTSVRLAGLQMAIELGPYDERQHSLKNVCFEMPDFFPPQHRQAVKTFYLFGIPVAGRKGLEYETFEAFQSASNSELYPNEHARRKAYLEVLRETPLYGAAYFRGFVERRPAESVMDIKTMVLNATLPSVEVLVALNRNYCAVLEASQLQLIFITSLSVCELGRFDVDEPPNGKTNAFSLKYLPILYLSVEDNSDCTDRALNVAIEETEVPQRFTLLPIYTRQVQLVQFLHKTLSKLSNRKPTQNISVCEEKRCSTSAPTTPEAINAKGDNGSSLRLQSDADITDSRNSLADSMSSRRTLSQTPLPCLPCHMNKMCVAKFDDSLRCLFAQGSLKKILQEVM